MTFTLERLDAPALSKFFFYKINDKTLSFIVAKSMSVKIMGIGFTVTKKIAYFYNVETSLQIFFQISGFDIPQLQQLKLELASITFFRRVPNFVVCF